MTGESNGHESPEPTLFDLLGITPAEIPSEVWPGMTLDWDSPLMDIQLHVELPFWLMMPDGDLTVSFKDCSLKASIIGTGIEIQYGRAFRKSRSAVAHFEKASKPSEKAQAVMRAAKDGFVLRLTRSIITLHTRALEDCSKAVDESGRRSVDAKMYFQCLAAAHLPFVNNIINAYRKSAADHFAMEVTEWDVPIWFLSIGDRLRRISLSPYADTDEFPKMLSLKDRSSQRIHLSTIEEVQAALKAGEIPGDIDLLDAWALYFRGRYGDAIRYLVTAIEVVLEYKLRDALAQKGLSDDEIEQRLERTLNDFEGRLADYIRVTRRRMPGPLISVIPYMNGLRLKWELDSARQLRHKVVHGSFRPERSMKGYLQRPMETMSWLFNWFRIESPIAVTGSGRKYILKMAMLAHLDCFSPEYTKDGVLIKNLPLGVDGPTFFMDGNLPLDQLIEAADRDTTDVEKFALMCFSYLKYRRTDSPCPEPQPHFLHERCFVSDSANKIVVFLIDTCELMSQALLQQVATRVLALKQQGTTFSSVICVVNHQNGLAWQLREVEKAIPDDVAQVAALCGVTLITVVDLLLLILGSKSYKWDADRIRAILSKPGRQGTCPPNCTRVGTVYHFYEEPQVVSVALDPSAVIRTGDMLVLRLPDRYHRQPVDSIQVKKSAVTEAHGEDRAGIKTTLHRGDVPLGSVVFIEEKEKL